MIRRSTALALSTLFLTTLAAACGGSPDEEPVVATPTVTLSHTRVPIGSPLTINYRFQVADGATFDDDYLVFLHVLDPDGERLWNDDHTPPRPTSTWKPGDVVEYSRTVFVPTYPYIGEGVLRIGLYKGSRRLALDGAEVTRREYEVGRMQILPQSENIFRIYKDGWHSAEVAADNPATEWQWTQKRATLSFRNPRADVKFYLDADARPDLLDAPQMVTLLVGGQQVGSFTADFRERKLQIFPISASQLGEEETVELIIEVDRALKPGGGDPRELGIRVFHAFVDARP